MTYDSAGRTASYNSWVYAYDAEGRMTSACKSSSCSGSIDKVEFTYDGDGHRTEIKEYTSGTLTTTRDFLYQGDAIVQESTNGTISREYIDDDTGKIIKFCDPNCSSPTTTYLVTWNGHGDALGAWKIDPSTGANFGPAETDLANTDHPRHHGCRTVAILRLENAISWLKAIAVSGAIAFAATGCIPTPSVTSYETAVTNLSSDGYIAVTRGGSYERFIPVRAGTTVVIDTVGHDDPETLDVTIIPATCAGGITLTGDFSHGGLVSIKPDGEVAVAWGRQSDNTPLPPDYLFGELTCVKAANDLRAAQTGTGTNFIRNAPSGA